MPERTYTTLTRDQQIEHLQQHKPDFAAAYSREDIAGYFREYAHIDKQDGHGALYLAVCSDLGIQPLGLTDFWKEDEEER